MPGDDPLHLLNVSEAGDPAYLSWVTATATVAVAAGEQRGLPISLAPIVSVTPGAARPVGLVWPAAGTVPEGASAVGSKALRTSGVLTFHSAPLTSGTTVTRHCSVPERARFVP